MIAIALHLRRPHSKISGKRQILKNTLIFKKKKLKNHILGLKKISDFRKQVPTLKPSFQYYFNILTLLKIFHYTQPEIRYLILR